MLVRLIILSCLTFGTSAAARTIYVANDCSGQSTPCTTNLQSALDNGAYNVVSMVGSSTFTGNFIIDRTLTLDGNGVTTVQRNSGETWVLRVEDASSVTLVDFDAIGRIGVSNSTSVTVDGIDITGNEAGLLVVDCTGVDIDSSDITGYRAVSVQNSTGVNFDTSTLTGTDFGLVASDAEVYAISTDMDGGRNAVVLQDGDETWDPDFEADSCSLTNGTAYEHVWTWDQASRTYSHTTVDEVVSTSANLVSTISYPEWPGN